MNILDSMNWRYATKRMNGSKVPQDKIETILESIRLAPTSFGLQAFKVFLIEKQELKDKLFEAAYQQAQIKEASHLIIFTAIKKVTTEIVDSYIAEIAHKRQKSIADLSGYRSMFDGIIAGSEEANFNWTSKQTYIALGVALVTAAELRVDSTPMEGFDRNSVDKILKLENQNLSSVSILTLGYRDEKNDTLASMPKIRKSSDELIKVL
jgi:nitroreductase/dihydropteridine reductase